LRVVNTSAAYETYSQRIAGVPVNGRKNDGVDGGRCQQVGNDTHSSRKTKPAATAAAAAARSAARRCH